ncbi:hypothetical protein BSNK01_18870 [Bacillaceae bacterium]
MLPQLIKAGEEYRIESIAFTNISTGVYRFPKDEAAKIALESVIESIQEGGLKSIKSILFVCFDPENYEIYKMLMESMIIKNPYWLFFHILFSHQHKKDIERDR